MSRSSLRKLILGSAIAALGVWYALEHVPTGAGPAEARAATTNAASLDEIVRELSPPTASLTPLDELEERRVLAAAPWPADPFFHFVAPEHEGHGRERTTISDTRPRFALTATMGGDHPLAIINGTVLSIGDQLADGSKITAIDDYAVKLQGPYGPWILKLSER